MNLTSDLSSRRQVFSPAGNDNNDNNDNNDDDVYSAHIVVYI